ncbi:MAG: agmatine deiminase family protein [Candidatus Micrarchaeota archaeon]|nr:agmatine deiminase family protein [Candidatus Micrarchaeota archaeon]
MAEEFSEVHKNYDYRLPAEFEEHEATWLSFPKNELTFPSSIIRKVQKTYCEIISALSHYEKVRILVDDEKHEQEVERLLEVNSAYNSNVEFYRIKSQDVWTRDYLPIFLVSSEMDKLGIVKWVFNAWGNKYDDLIPDNISGIEVARSIYESKGSEKAELFFPDMVLEGGSIDCDGKGILLTTEQCLLNKNRNPHLTKEEIEEKLKNYLNVQKIVWLRNGIVGDDTDGHVDDFCRFSEKCILIAHERNWLDENNNILNQNLKLLTKFVESEELDYEIKNLPMPDPLYDTDNKRLPASYANFYVANKIVLLPVFDSKHDTTAIEILAQAFPTREIVMIKSKELVYGLGGIHCITMQQPKINDD